MRIRKKILASVFLVILFTYGAFVYIFSVGIHALASNKINSHVGNIDYENIAEADARVTVPLGRRGNNIELSINAAEALPFLFKNSNTIIENSSGASESREWVHLTDMIYLKRTSAFYFADIGKFYVNFIASDSVPLLFDWSIRLRLLPPSKQAGLSESNSDEGELLADRLPVDAWNVRYVQLSPTTFCAGKVHTACLNFNMREELERRKLNHLVGRLDEVQIELIVSLTSQMLVSKAARQQNTADSPLPFIVLPVRFMFWDLVPFAQKRSSMICSKFLFKNQDPEELTSFELWLKMMRRIGYSRIQINDVPFEARDLFGPLYARYDGFLAVKPIRSIPNVDFRFKTRGEPLYYATFESFSNFVSNDNYFYLTFDLIYTIELNECYMENRQHYRYIGIYEEDQIILPRFDDPLALNHLLIDNIQSHKLLNIAHLDAHMYCSKGSRSEQASTQAITSTTPLVPLNSSTQPTADTATESSNSEYLDSYMAHIAAANRFQEPLSLMFQYATFIDTWDVNFFCEHFLSNSSGSRIDMSFEKPYAVIIDRGQEQTVYTLTVNNFKEYTYALQLCLVNRNYVEPYLRKTNYVTSDVLGAISTSSLNATTENSTQPSTLEVAHVNGTNSTITVTDTTAIIFNSTVSNLDYSVATIHEPPLRSTPFGRVYFIKSRQAKSVHDTRRTILLENHFTREQMKMSHRAPKTSHSDYWYWYAKRDFDFVVDYKYGFISHYRKKYKFYKDNLNNVVPVSELGVDLEYMICYLNLEL